MRRWIGFLAHLAIITVLTSFATFKIVFDDVNVPSELRNVEHLIPQVPTALDLERSNEKYHPIFLRKNFVGFKEALAFKESQGDYSTVNTLGYLGKYQFGASTLKLMGVHDVDLFLADPYLQETIFALNVSRNKWILRRDIKRFVGKRINGTEISTSGIIAAAHLAGAGNVKKYLRSYGRQDFSDAYGSSVAYYLKKFGGYDIEVIPAQRNPRI